MSSTNVPRSRFTVATPFRTLGPAIIVASIVLGPGSVLTSSKVGCEYGYSMLWLLATAVLLMIGMTALGAYLGATQRQTPCSELAAQAGRPAAIAVGAIVFAIIACFQSSNNAAVLASIEGFATAASERAPVGAASKVAILLVLNGLIIATIYGFRRLYRPLELLMMTLVLTMLIAFGVNLAFAAPSLSGVLLGFVPRMPTADNESGSLSMSLWALLGLVATTFSVAGAFYQCYLVREKGWSQAEVRQGLVDSFTGIVLLGMVSGIVMITSAAALHGRVAPEELTSAAAIARQLEPFFGSSATILFSCGIFAAAFSSFLGNALIGGTVLSDGLGLGHSIDDVWPKRLTVVALIVGIGVACYTTVMGNNAVDVIVFAQALTVLGLPALATMMLWLGFTARRRGTHVPFWILSLSAIGCIVTLLLATRALFRVWQAFIAV